MAKKSSNLQYAGFWIRLLAVCIDSIIFYVLYFLLGIFLVFTPLSLFASLILAIIASCLLMPVYEIYFISKYGGTIGKLLMKCKAVDSKGNNISMLDSVVRYFSKRLSGLTLGIGYLMIAWDKKKQGLHDRIAETFVVYDNKSKITNKSKKYILVFAILIMAGYFAYIIYLSTISIGVTLGALHDVPSNELNKTFSVQSVMGSCTSKLPYYQNVCISQYLKLNSMEFDNSSAKSELCSKLTGQYKISCTADLAIKNRNAKFCDDLNSQYSKRLCKKQFDFGLSMVNFLNLNSLFEGSGANQHLNYVTNTQLNGTTQTYTLEGDYYELTPLVNKDSVQFIINGWLTPPLREGQIEYVSGGAYVKVNQIIVHSSGNYVIFELGKEKNNIEEFIKSNPNSIRDTLQLGQTKTYTIKNVDYEITLDHVYATSAQFIVNGWTSKQLVPGQEDSLPDGSHLLLVRTSKGNSNYKFAEFLLGNK